LASWGSTFDFSPFWAASAVRFKRNGERSRATVRPRRAQRGQFAYGRYALPLWRLRPQLEHVRYGTSNFLLLWHPLTGSLPEASEKQITR